MTKTKNNLIVFTGPSGVGKGTVVKKLFASTFDLEFSVSCTTRTQRPGEEEGVNYFFKTKEQFEAMIAANELLEWAIFVDNYYGTPKKFVQDTLASGKDVFLEIEVQGALQVMEKYPECLSIFLVPPRFQDLEERLRKRGTESEEILQKRLEKAKNEMQYIDRFQHVVTNDDAERAAKILSLLVLQARGLGVC